VTATRDQITRAVRLSPPRTAAAVQAPTTAAAPLLGIALTPARIVFALALCAGAALRLIGLGAVGLNSDEAVYASQAASLAGNPHYSGLFPIVRAHPLLLQMLVSPLYAAGRPDTVGRYIAAAFGIGTIVLVYFVGKILYGANTGAVGALFLAVMPYHVTVTRQFLLDGPMTFFTTAALLCMAKAVASGSRRWLIGVGICLGLSALCKETGLVLLIAAVTFLSIHARVWRPAKFPLGAAAAAFGLTLAYPALTAFAGGASGGQSYLLWQLTRHPNHDLLFYPETVGAAMGFLPLAVAAYGLVIRPSFSWREALLLSWIVVPLMYFEVWPVKGFAYLMPVAPAVALLAGRGIERIAHVASGGRRRMSVIIAGVVALVCAVVLAVPAASSVGTRQTSGLAGGGGTPGGRETGKWVAAHLPPDASLMTIGPSMANLIR
jgi:4-amino-4-deoxy-L-arabinose transferase-like glycosyltransferase